jgi:hypothetical protein
MQVKDPEIFSLIGKMSEHFQANLGNRHLKPAFAALSLDQKTLSLLDSVTEKYVPYAGQAMHVDELYERILAVARFVFLARRDLQPSLRSMLAGRAAPSPNDKVLRDMAVSNFGSNLGLLADQVNQLFQKVVAIDEAMNGKERAVHRTTPQLAELAGLLQPR